MKYRIVHVTRYAYEQPVRLCHNEAHLQPRATSQQRCAYSEVEVRPEAAQRAEREDMFGNRVDYFALQAPHQELVVTSTSEVRVEAPTALPASSPPWDEVVAMLHQATDPETLEARQFVLDSPFAAMSAEVSAWAAACFAPRRPLLEAVAGLCARIHDELAFDPKLTTVSTPPSAVLAQRGGVCQDYAHLAIAALRSKGIPARYVSGYVETLPPPGQERLRGADVSHAWFAAYLPNYGWVDFDPTNNLRPSDRHVTIAWGRDYGDVAPLKGVVFGGGAHAPEVSVDMVALEEP